MSTRESLAFDAQREDRDGTEEAIYDRARALLTVECVAGPHPDRPYYACPGCDLLVDQTDATYHALMCEPLRTLAVEEMTALTSEDER